VFAYDWHFDRLAPYAQAFVSGLEYSIALAICTILFSTTLGVLWGIAIRRSEVFRILATPVIDILKSLPPLVVVLFGYFFFAQNVVGVSVPAFVTFVIALGVNQAAFIADLTRAAATNVPHELVELGEALGLSESRVLRKVVAPIAIREMIAPLSYLWIDALKLTSLASVINVREMVYVAQDVITRSSRSLEVWVIVSLIYIAIIWPATFLVRHMEIRLKRTAGLGER